MQSEAKERLAGIRLLAMDVDGVLTDGTLSFDSEGREHKRFHVADGLGLVLMRQIGVEVAWITGRASAIVERRAGELGIRHVVQGVRDKRAALLRLCADMSPPDGLPLAAVAYIGDDWNDLSALSIAGAAISVPNGAEEAQAAAHLVTRRAGGHGAVREVCEWILEAKGQRQLCLAAYLASLQEPPSEHERGQSGQ